MSRRPSTSKTLGVALIVIHASPTTGSASPRDQRQRPLARSPEEQAADQRAVAADACKERRWDECEKALNRAARLDPESDGAAEVKELRAAIAAGRLGAQARDAGARDGPGAR